MPETKERESVGERIRAPSGFVKDLDVFGNVAAREKRRRSVRIVVAGRDEDGPPEAGELLE
jgi:hypothetical protein